MSDKPTRGEVAVFALFILIAMLAMSGCTTVPGPAFDWRDVPGHDPDYNAAGGYSDACGELPPILGDDC